MTTRALRNMNPLNLRPSGDNWDGLREEQTDPGYLQFQSNFHGLRAGAMNLLTYFRVHRRRTVRSIITSWAPPEDNNPTNSYISTVCAALGVGPDDLINLENGNTLRTLMEAMIRVEAGSQPFSRLDIEEGINAAYGSHRSPPVVHPLDRPPETRVYPAHPETPEPPEPSETKPMPSPAPRDEIVPPRKTDKPDLVDQPTAAPTRKVVAGGLAGAVAFVVMVGWNRLFPSTPIPAEFATEIAGVVILGVTLLTQYFTRNRKTDIPPATPPEDQEEKS
jgi:hypothetical protein